MYYKIQNFTVGLFLWALFILLISSLSFASDDKSSITIDKAKVKAMIKRAEPLIEEVTGRKFKKRMKFKVVERVKLYDVLIKTITPVYKKIYKNMDEKTIARSAESEATQISQNLMGLYSPLKKSFYVIPNNVDSSIELYEVKKENFDDFVFLIVTHEMVHALDDQYFNLTDLQRSRKNEEESQALINLIEGNAVYVTEIIADKLNIPYAARTFSKKTTADFSNAHKLAIEKYIKGYDFVEAIIKEKGVTGIEAAFKSPPVSTRQILYPEEYFKPVDIANIDYSTLLEKVTKGLASEGMQTRTIALGAMDLQKSLISSGIPTDEASMIAKGCLTGSIYLSVKPVAKPRRISIQIINFNDSDSVSKFYKANLKIEESSVKQANASLNTKLKIIKEEDLNLEGYDLVRFREVEIDKIGSVSTTMGITGLMNNNYISVGYVNMKDVTQDDAIKVLKEICVEYLKMVKDSTATAL